MFSKVFVGKYAIIRRALNAIGTEGERQRPSDLAAEGVENSSFLYLIFKKPNVFYRFIDENSRDDVHFWHSGGIKKVLWASLIGIQFAYVRHFSQRSGSWAEQSTAST